MHGPPTTLFRRDIEDFNPFSHFSQHFLIKCNDDNRIQSTQVESHTRHVPSLSLGSPRRVRVPLSARRQDLQHWRFRHDTLQHVNYERCQHQTCGQVFESSDTRRKIRNNDQIRARVGNHITPRRDKGLKNLGHFISREIVRFSPAQ